MAPQPSESRTKRTHRVGRSGLLVAIAACLLVAAFFAQERLNIAVPDKIRLLLTGIYALLALLTLWFVFFERTLLLIDTGIEWVKSLGWRPLRLRHLPSATETALAVMFLVAIIWLPVNALSRPDAAYLMVREDSPIEALTSVFYLVSAAACLRLLWRASGYTWLRLHALILALLFFFVGMEEISWGQRLLNFSTPELVDRYNNQGEFTIHNLYSISLFQYPGLALTSVLLCVFPLWQRYSSRWSGFLTALQFPVAPVRSAWLYLAGLASYFALGFTFGTPTPLPIAYGSYMPSADDEYLEFYLSCLFLTFSVTNWRIVFPSSVQDPPI